MALRGLCGRCGEPGVYDKGSLHGCLCDMAGVACPSVKGHLTPYSPFHQPSSPANSVRFSVEGRAVSVNRCYRRARNGRMFISPEGREFKERVAQAARAAMHGRPLLKGPLTLEVAWYFDRAISGTDIAFPDDDGPLKPTRDALEGVVYENDRWIVRTVTSKHLDRERPRCEVEVWALERG